MPIINGRWVPPRRAVIRPRAKNYGLVCLALMVELLEQEIGAQDGDMEAVLQSIRKLRGEDLSKRDDRNLWPGGYQEMATYIQERIDALKARPF